MRPHLPPDRLEAAIAAAAQQQIENEVFRSHEAQRALIQARTLRLLINELRQAFRQYCQSHGQDETAAKLELVTQLGWLNDMPAEEATQRLARVLSCQEIISVAALQHLALLLGKHIEFTLVDCGPIELHRRVTERYPILPGPAGS